MLIRSGTSFLSITKHILGMPSRISTSDRPASTLSSLDRLATLLVRQDTKDVVALTYMRAKAGTTVLSIKNDSQDRQEENKEEDKKQDVKEQEQEKGEMEVQEEGVKEQEVEKEVA